MRPPPLDLDLRIVCDGDGDGDGRVDRYQLVRLEKVALLGKERVRWMMQSPVQRDVGDGGGDGDSGGGGDGFLAGREREWRADKGRGT